MERVKLAGLLALLAWTFLINVNFFVPSEYSSTPLGGHITQDTTLTLANSPYRVVEDVIVNSGAKLNIEAGVKVEFANGFSLIVNGTLHAVGAQDRLITFTSSRLDPIPGAWKTVKFIGGESFVIKHSVITYAMNGITIATQDGCAVIENNEICNNSESGILLLGKSNVIIRGNSIKQNKNGIRTDVVDADSGILAVDNSISFNQENGIYMHSYGQQGYGYICNATLSCNMISSNGQDGIHMHSYGCFPDGRQFTFGYIHSINVSFNNILLNRRSGIYMYSYGQYSKIHNITVSSNTVSLNGQDGIHLHSYGCFGYGYGFGYIHSVNVSFNDVSFNRGSGIYMHSYGQQGYAYIYNATLFSNTVSSNEQDGIHLQSDYVYNVDVSSNAVSSNGEDGIDAWAPYRSQFTYDLTIHYNTVSANDEKGVSIGGGINANLSHNVISYNLYGIFYTSTKNNTAKHNNICRNSYGMNVTEGSTVTAEYNYWDDSSGPYHGSLNPEGKGNPVNGDGTDLEFIPFLPDATRYINERPIAELTADKATIFVGQCVTFDASASTDDGRVDKYFFDFGDGKNSSWTIPSVIEHNYTSIGVCTASLTVIDDFGVKSNNTATTIITVTQEFPTLSVSLTIDRTSVNSSSKVSVQVHVTDGISAVEEALIQLLSDKGGTFTPQSGYTNQNGNFSTAFIAPSVSEQTNITITVNATKAGYLSGQGQVQITVNPSQPDLTLWIYIAIVIIVFATISIAVAIARRESQELKQEPTPFPNHKGRNRTVQLRFIVNPNCAKHIPGPFAADA